MTTQELYDVNIKAMPISERLKLATLILNDIPPQAVVDYRTEWSDEDLAEFTRQNWIYIDSELEKTGDA